jgi:hypothetical protein
MAGSATEAVVANSDSTKAWIFSLGDWSIKKTWSKIFCGAKKTTMTMIACGAV